ncbi:hypothetical protein KIN20_028511 [Parelaphostrongylus tenuis]|uniref:non-specific serine/threonine protein kinase n=1 Tax=Parelaphostrongylus tenuis TaxID=148309 RepID=A0AAD5R0W2_PARTN|nr:hypothetical protein KIN20_028511 [Parelaphostrongylus tenuis]
MCPLVVILLKPVWLFCTFCLNFLHTFAVILATLGFPLYLLCPFELSEDLFRYIAFQGKMSSDDDEFATEFSYEIQTDGVRQGAEARIFDCTYLGRPAIMKERFVKNYRHPALDLQLNRSRIRNEVRGLVKAQELGIGVPAVFFVDDIRNKIIMERIEGCTANSWIESRRLQVESLEQFVADTLELGKAIGEAIGKMHLGNLIHGDLTTSNIIIRDEDIRRLFFIDFGLSSLGKVSSEDKGVDLYVLERALSSTHRDSEQMFEKILEAYQEVNCKQGSAVIKKLDEIRLRGRKRDMTG